MSWPPTTEGELHLALEGGLLAEHHRLDIKKGPPANNEAGNRALAIDLASFAVDGGWIVYGVAEDENKRPATLAPFPTAGVRDRIDQVAYSGRIDPPLAVTSIEIPSDVDPAAGYVIATVLASPGAPHMVDGVYRGRSDGTNRALTDADVVRLHDRRRSAERVVSAALDAMVEADPIPAGLLGHLFVIAHPAQGSPEQFYENVDAGPSWQSWIHTRVIRGEPCKRWSPSWSPDITDSSRVARRAEGWAIQPPVLDAEDDVANHEPRIAELLITDDGQVRGYCSAITHPIRDSDQVVTHESVVMGITKRAVLTARTIGEAMGYVGTWDLGIHLERIGGTYSAAGWNDMTWSPRAYTQARYRRLASTNTTELDTDPDVAVKRLTDLFCRGLNDGNWSRPPG